MSFQSLLESTECGTTNPMVDLARQLTSATTTSTNVAPAGSGIDDRPSDIVSLDELNGIEGNTFSSTVESLLFQNNDMQDGQTPFNMESLLNEINQMENRLSDPDVLNGNDLSQNEQQSYQLKTESSDPLICNLSPSVEKDFWKEVTTEFYSAGTSNQNTKLPELDVDWADEYLRKLELNNNSLIDQHQQLENVWDLKEKEHIESEKNAYRNQPIPENVVDSFFASNLSTGQSGFLPFIKPFSNQNQQPVETISDANLNDLVSDQESRLINMLLGNTNQSGSSMFPPKESSSEEESARFDQQPENGKQTELNQTQPVQSENVAQQPTINNQEQIQLPDSESKYYENQFDDMEFWLKLAEEWHSNDNANPVLSTGDILDQPSTGHLGQDGKQIQIRESLSDLMEPNHPYHYNCVDDNPFVQKDKSETEIDFVEEGLARMKTGDLSAAVLLFEAAIQTKPEDLNAWRLLGVANAKNENDHKSISAMKRCLAILKLESETISETDKEIQLDALMYLATGFTNESMTSEACYALQEWIRRHPKYKNLHRDHHLTMNKNEPYMGPTPLSQRWTTTTNIFSDGFFDSVKQSFLDAAQQNPEQPDPDVQCGLGVLHNISGEYSKAIDCYQAALQSRPDDYCLWNRYGASLANGGRAEESMFAYREALVRYPGYIRARYNLAISCIMLGVAGQAIEHLLAILKLQTAGADSVKDLVSLNRDNITSVSVWNLMRTALTMHGRTDLMEAVDERNLELLNRELIEKREKELNSLENEESETKKENEI